MLRARRRRRSARPIRSEVDRSPGERLRAQPRVPRTLRHLLYPRRQPGRLPRRSDELEPHSGVPLLRSRFAGGEDCRAAHPLESLPDPSREHADQAAGHPRSLALAPGPALLLRRRGQALQRMAAPGPHLPGRVRGVHRRLAPMGQAVHARQVRRSLPVLVSFRHFRPAARHRRRDLPAPGARLGHGAGRLPRLPHAHRAPRAGHRHARHRAPCVLDEVAGR